MSLEVPAQSAPDIPPAPPAKVARRSRWIAGFLILLALGSAGYLVTELIQQGRAKQRAVLFNHMRSLSVVLFEFDPSMEAFPPMRHRPLFAKPLANPLGPPSPRMIC
jgi:hypothetical protein